MLEPLFNHFQPLADEQLAQQLRLLANQAGVPIRNVLVADASRRTVKANAYVSGLGPTRRVVVWDTLLRTAGEREVKLVVAHELGHRRERHIVKGTALAIAAAVVAVLLIRLALGTPEPGDYPIAALILIGLELAALPFAAALSRRWERTADRYSLQLTGDRDAFIQTHLTLARTNLADLDPPRLAYLTLFTHPTPPERLASPTARRRSDRASPELRIGSIAPHSDVSEWPEHLAVTATRVARPTDRLDEVRSFYGEALGLPEIASFANHAGYSVDRLHERLVARGHPTVQPENPYWETVVSSFTLGDPDGWRVVSSSHTENLRASSQPRRADYPSQLNTRHGGNREQGGFDVHHGDRFGGQGEEGGTARSGRAPDHG